MTKENTIAIVSQESGNRYFTSPRVFQKAIEYNHLEASYFIKRGFKAEETTFHNRGYIEDSLDRVLQKNQRDVTVINVGVGQGKTYTAHKLIQHYAEKGYIVIVASPYTALVERDYKALEGRSELSVVSYKDLNEASLQSHINADVHVMTVNMLLKNPGEGGRAQAYIKTAYLEGLLERCSTDNRRITLFIDEVHESTQNFQQEFIENLLPWKTFTHKVFILSATFSEASKLVVQQLAMLVNNRIVIYNCTRHKAGIRSNLHLYLTSKPYSASSLNQLQFIQEIIRDARSKNRKVNILSGTKSLAMALVNEEVDHPLSQFISQLNYNIITADNHNVFDEEKINIGTKFGTGISISDPQSVLIIILPVVNDPSREESRGLFSDGASAVIQAIARLRNGGDIHIVGLKPKVLIDGEYTGLLPEFLTEITNTEPHVTYEEQLNLVSKEFSLKSFYRKELSRVSGFDLHHIQMPFWSDFIMRESQKFLVKTKESFGRTLSPYIVWAAFNDQFPNADLKRVVYIDTEVQRVNVGTSTANSDLKKLLSPSIATRISNASDIEALEILIRDIYKPNRTLKSLSTSSLFQQERKNEIIYNGKSVAETDIKRYSALMKEIINILYELRHEEREEYDASRYFLFNIKLAAEYNSKQAKERDKLINSLTGTYVVVKQIRDYLLKHLPIGSPVANADKLITSEIEDNVKTAAAALREWDPFIRSRTYSFLQTSHRTPISKRKSKRDMIATALVKLFFETKRVKVQGAKIKLIAAVKPIDKPGLNLIF